MAKLTIPNLTPGVKYSIQVQAQDDKDKGPWSHALVFTANKKVVAPGYISNLTGTVLVRAYKINWDAPTTNQDGTDLKDLDYYLVNITDGTTTVQHKSQDTHFHISFDRMRAAFGGNLPTSTTWSVYSVDTSGNMAPTPPSVIITVATPNPTSTFGPGPTSPDTPNGVSSVLLIETSSAYPDANGYTFKRLDSTYGSSSPYGSGQAFEVLSPSTQAANDLTGDGLSTGNENPVLLRIDRFGGLGVAGGIHVAPGLRNTYGSTPIGIWIQRFSDAYGVLTSSPNPSRVAVPTMPHFMATDYNVNYLAGIDAQGNVVTYGSNGTTVGAALYPLDTVVTTGFRAVFNTINAGTGGLGIVAATSQTASLLTAYAAGGTQRLAGITSGGWLVTYADDGSTAVASIYPSDAGISGYRAIFTTKNAATGGIAVKGATSQAGMYFAAVNSSAVLMSGINNQGHLTTYADDGSTPLAGIYATSAGNSGYRAILSAGTNTVKVLGLKGAASQSGNLLEAVNSTPTLMSAISALGWFVTYATNGTTTVGGLYSGDTPTGGYRMILVTQTAGTGGLGITLKTGQTADAITVVDAGGVTRSIVDKNAQVTGTLRVAGVGAPTNTTTPAGWFNAVTTAGSTVKIPIYT